MTIKENVLFTKKKRKKSGWWRAPSLNSGRRAGTARTPDGPAPRAPRGKRLGPKSGDPTQHATKAGGSCHLARRQ